MRLFRFLTVAVLAITAGFTASCGGKTPLTAEQQCYAGVWTSPSGSRIVIEDNGAADLELHEGGVNVSVNGGKVVFEDNVLSIKLMGIGNDFYIDMEPEQRNGRWVMILDGMEFSKR